MDDNINKFDIQNEMLLSNFHELPWYLMTKKQQMSYAHSLNRLQNGAVFHMGPFAVLNFVVLSDVISLFVICIA